MSVGALEKNVMNFCGADGARTRDPRRDRTGGASSISAGCSPIRIPKRIENLPICTGRRWSYFKLRPPRNKRQRAAGIPLAEAGESAHRVHGQACRPGRTATWRRSGRVTNSGCDATRVRAIQRETVLQGAAQIGPYVFGRPLLGSLLVRGTGSIRPQRALTVLPCHVLERPFNARHGRRDPGHSVR
jgi:hypothetical protein